MASFSFEKYTFPVAPKEHEYYPWILPELMVMTFSIMNIMAVWGRDPLFVTPFLFFTIIVALIRLFHTQRRCDRRHLKSLQRHKAAVLQVLSEIEKDLEKHCRRTTTIWFESIREEKCHTFKLHDNMNVFEFKRSWK